MLLPFSKGIYMQGIQNQKRIQLSDHFSYGRLIRFTLPSIIIMIFSACYGIVDGYFISKYVGKTAFASVNLIIPFVQIIGVMGVVFGADGSALIARTLGMGNREKAGRYFTMTMIAALFGSILFTVVGLVALKPAASYLGASDANAMIEDCLIYGKICIMFTAAQLGQRVLLEYLVVAGKRKFAARVMTFAFLLNIVLDILFVHKRFLNMGVAGAAWATGISQTFAAGVPLLWFASKRNKTALRFRKTKIELSAMRKASYTGSAEAVSTLAAPIVGLLYNSQLMKFSDSGADAVAAYGVVLYVSFIFTNVYSGFSSGCSPIMGYHYGANRKREMRNVFKMSLVILAIVTIAMLSIVVILAKPISIVFAGYNDWKLVELTTKTLYFGIMPFLFMWFNVYLSSVFSSIDKSFVAAVFTVLRVVVFPVVCILVFPPILGLYGVWYALAGAEALSAVAALLVFSTQRKKFKS